MSKIIAGIDPGVKTGLAIWDCGKQRFEIIKTLNIIQAQGIIRGLWNHPNGLKEVWFEDARLRKWFEEPKNSSAAIARLQGAGSIKRESAIWQEFCEYYKIPFKAISPADVYANFPLPPGTREWSAKDFKKMTGWKGQTSKHARVAAALVYGI